MSKLQQRERHKPSQQSRFGKTLCEFSRLITYIIALTTFARSLAPMADRSLGLPLLCHAAIKTAFSRRDEHTSRGVIEWDVDDLPLLGAGDHGQLVENGENDPRILWCAVAWSCQTVSEDIAEV
jgi:hypothetical protein